MIAKVLMGILAIGASRPGHAQGGQPVPLPSRLTDAEFWRLMTVSSEPGGSFPSDNWTSNEMAFPTVIDRLRSAGDTAGAYLGVGPEQNFSYIAGTHPRIAFLVDIRRQSVIQHLMYKAIFELSADRADFVSLLFSKPRPAGLTTASSIADIWEGYWYVATDSSAFTRNLGRIVSQLRDTHGFALDSADLASLRTVYHAFYDFGPSISYNSTTTVSASRVMVALPLPVGVTAVKTPMVVAKLFAPIDTSDSTRSTLTGTVRNLATGATIPGTTVKVFSPTGPSMQVISNDSGVYVIPPLPGGITVSLSISRVGYAPLSIDSIRLNQRLVTRNIEVAPSIMTLADVTAAAYRTFTLPPSATAYYGGVNFAALTAALDSAGVPGSFLATENNYRYMKDLHSRNLFIPIVGDFAGPKAIRAVGEYLRTHGATLTTFYTSNVEQYLFSNQVWRAFYDNAATLPVTPSSVFIRNGTSICPIGAFLAAVTAGRVTSASDAMRCVL
jgi:hypothetical protein